MKGKSCIRVQAQSMLQSVPTTKRKRRRRANVLNFGIEPHLLSDEWYVCLYVR